jgi:RNA polymerase sigma-70 factor (ECF subfamily)
MTHRTGPPPAGLPDGLLVRRTLGGDPDSFGTLVERYRAQFARYAASLCGDADLAADAMQEAFIRAYEALETCRDPERFGSWFFRILTNQCHNHRDRRRVHVPLEKVTAVGTTRTDDDVRRAEIREAVGRGLDALTPEQREAFVLRQLEDRSYAEIEAMTGVGVDALKMRVYRAREIMKEYLENLL